MKVIINQSFINKLAQGKSNINLNNFNKQCKNNKINLIKVLLIKILIKMLIKMLIKL